MMNSNKHCCNGEYDNWSIIAIAMKIYDNYTNNEWKLTRKYRKIFEIKNFQWYIIFFMRLFEILYYEKLSCMKIRLKRIAHVLNKSDFVKRQMSDYHNKNDILQCQIFKKWQLTIFVVFGMFQNSCTDQLQTELLSIILCIKQWSRSNSQDSQRKFAKSVFYSSCSTTLDLDTLKNIREDSYTLHCFVFVFFCLSLNNPLMYFHETIEAVTS